MSGRSLRSVAISPRNLSRFTRPVAAPRPALSLDMSRRRGIESRTCSCARSSTHARRPSRRRSRCSRRTTGRAPLAGGQTLVNVMKARAAAPDVLVDLADLEELRTIGFSSDGMLEIGAMVTYAQLMASSEVDVARPILAEVASTIADVQVRNRGTVGGNVCVSDPTNHLPPLLVALDATFTIRGAGGERTVSADEFFLGVYMTAVGEGELLTKVYVPPSKRRRRRLRRAHDRRSRDVHRERGGDGLRRRCRIAIGCVAAAPVRADRDGGAARRATTPRTRCAPRPRGSARRSIRRRTCTARRTTGAISRRSRRCGRSCRRRGGRSVVAAHRRRAGRSRIEVNGERYEREVPARRLLVHFIRDDLGLTGTHIGCDTGNCGACTVHVDGEAVKSCMMLAVQAEGAKIATVEGLAADGELTALQQAFNEHHALQCGYCTPGMLMSATALLAQQPAPDRGGRPRRDPGQHLPLHGLREHRRGRGRGRWREHGRDDTTVHRVETGAPQTLEKGFVGQIDPAQGGQAARPGPGHVLRRRAPARDGLRPLRPLAVRARARSSRSTSRRRSSSTACTGRSRATRSRSHGSVLRDVRRAGREHQGLRARGRPRAAHGRAGRGGVRRRRASSRATPPSWSRSSTRSSRCSSTRRSR